MFERLSRSCALTMACWKVLAQDKELQTLPLMSVAALCAVIASFFVPFLATHPSIGSLARTLDDPSLRFYVGVLLLFVFIHLVIGFFNAALITVALERFDGEPVTASEGLRLAAAKLPNLVVYSMVAAGSGLTRSAWRVASRLAVPVLTAENVGPTEAVERSASLHRKCWGESIVGRAEIGFLASLASMVAAAIGLSLMLLGALDASVDLVMGAGAFLVVGLTGITLVSETLQAIYSVALYRFATGSRRGPFDDGLLVDAFKAKQTQ